MSSKRQNFWNTATLKIALDIGYAIMLSLPVTPRHSNTLYFFLAFFLAAVEGSAATPCSSLIRSLIRLSLTPPPLKAGLYTGKISFIFHPFGIAGGGGGLSFVIPGI